MRKSKTEDDYRAPTVTWRKTKRVGEFAIYVDREHVGWVRKLPRQPGQYLCPDTSNWTGTVGSSVVSMDRPMTLRDAAAEVAEAWRKDRESLEEEETAWRDEQEAQDAAWRDQQDEF